MYRFQNGNPSYGAEISRTDPTLFIFLLDQSESMEDPFGGSGAVSKAAFISDAVLCCQFNPRKEEACRRPRLRSPMLQLLSLQARR
jgi:hypothetical protein